MKIVNVYPVLATTLFLIHSVACARKTRPNNNPDWPILYYTDGPVPKNATLDGLIRPLNETELLPDAKFVLHYNSTSETYRSAVFHAKLSKSSNCRPSFDKWDCEGCKSFLPDGAVVRTFGTFPVGINGNIVVSEKQKTIFVQVRGASSLRNKLTFGKDTLVPHPTIPNAHVQQGLLQALDDIREILHNTMTDQLRLHPDYIVQVTGHSFGGGVGSLVVVDLHQTFPQLNNTNLFAYLYGKPRVGDYNYAKYVGDEKIQIRRMLQAGDDIVHRPNIRDGYVHEGDEYWLRSSVEQVIMYCPGPFETRNCSNSLSYGTILHHLTSFGILQDCKDVLYNMV